MIMVCSSHSLHFVIYNNATYVHTLYIDGFVNTTVCYLASASIPPYQQVSCKKTAYFIIYLYIIIMNIHYYETINCCLCCKWST